MSLTFGSLFAGIGGIDLGFERAGMVCKWQVEIDDYCNRVLERHWPDVRRYRDVKTVGKHNLEPVDVIVGGYPCQPHSVAGKRKGAADDRNLWPEYLRIVEELRPTWVVGENVPGIVTTYLDTVLSDLEGAGYEIQTFNIPAVALDAQHRRERIFVVAYSSDGKRNARAKIPSSLLSMPENRTVNDNADGSNSHVPNANDIRFKGRGTLTSKKGYKELETGQPERLVEEPGYWRTIPEPRLRGVAHGVSNRVDRLRGLGNAVVPQVAEFIGRAIVTAAALTSYPHPAKAQKALAVDVLSN